MEKLDNLTKDQLIEQVEKLNITIKDLKKKSKTENIDLEFSVDNETSDIDDHFKLLMDQSPSVIEIYALNGMQVAVNKAYEKLWGFPASTTLGKFNVFKSKDFVDKGIIDYINKAYNGEEVILPEYKFNPKGETETKKLGRGIWLSTRIFPLKDKHGKIINIVITHEDISDGKEIESNLKKSNERYYDLVETINSGVAIYKVLNKGESGNDYIFKDFNKAAEKIEGISKDEVIGKSLKELRPNIEDFGLIPIFKKVWETGIPAYFPAKQYVDNKYSNYYENRVFRLSSGEIVAIYDDVTEKENANIEVLRSKERFDMAMKASKDGLYDWNLITNEIYYSPGWKKMLGYKDNELANEFSVWETLTEPDDLTTSWNMLNELINKKIDRFEMEFQMKHKDGHWVDILSRAEAVFNKEGKAIRVVGTHVDITRRKLAEEEIKLSEEKWKSITTNTQDHIMLLNTDFSIEYINKTVSDLTMEEVIGKSSLDFTPDNYKKITADCFNRVIESGNPDMYETTYLTKDGDEMYFEVRVSPIFDENGKVNKLISTSNNVTERKKTEHEIIINEAKFRGLFESKLIGQIFWNDKGDITDANKAFLEMMGYTFEEIINKDIDWKDMTPPEYAERDEQLLLELADVGVISPIEKEYFHKDGHRIPIMIGAATLPGQTTKGVAFILDISSQKKAELESMKLQSTLDLAQEMANIGFWNFNIKTKKPTWSDQMFVMLGVDKKNGPLTYEDHKKIWHPDDWEMFDTAVQECIEGTPYDIVIRIILPDGSLNYLNTQGFPSFDKEGNLVELFGTSIDITSLKTTEEELRKHKENLEELIVKRTEELEQKNKELDNALKVFVGREKTINELQSRIRILESNF